MNKWEYMTVENIEENLGYLLDLGSEGWEVVGVWATRENIGEICKSCGHLDDLYMDVGNALLKRGVTEKQD